MANILIIGAGSMGTAFSFPCFDNGHSVTIIGTHLENNFIDQINLKRMHPTLKCEVPKNVKFLKFDKLVEEINKKVDLIAVAVISKGIEWASIELSKILKSNIPILILTKGLAINNNNYEVLAHKMERLLKKNGIKETNISAAGGPCLAKGLANRVHTSVVFANTDINKAIKSLTESKIKVSGPVPADSSFMIFKKYKFDVIIGMYHDQVLAPFKAIYNFNAINITLGLPYIRISPDHGVAENITGKKIASPRSLIESIKFFNYIN